MVLLELEALKGKLYSVLNQGVGKKSKNQSIFLYMTDVSSLGMTNKQGDDYRDMIIYKSQLFLHQQLLDVGFGQVLKERIFL